MSWLAPFRLPRERVGQPLVGYKLAYPMLSADGTVLGFSGVSLGRCHVYGVVADGVCVQGGRHDPPGRFCDCGFYCLRSLEAAQALTCDPQYRSAVVLQVLASGRFIRYEKGLRYARQHVRVMRVGRCSCGGRASVLVDAGSGQPGWRQLRGTCEVCAGMSPALMLATAARLAGHGLRITTDDGWPATAAGPVAPLPAYPLEGHRHSDPDAEVTLLEAEASLLQARLDQLQEHVQRLSRPND